LAVFWYNENIMSLSIYHQKYASLSDKEIAQRTKEKAAELKTIFENVKITTANEPMRIAVLGCGDKRYVSAHKKLFEEFYKKSVELTTFDITVEHLAGEENIIQHDCTLPLPNPPYHITYDHTILKFIETKKQWNILKNSYNALKPGGVAIHIIDKSDYETTVPLGQWKKKLRENNIKFQEIPVKYGLALILIR